VYSEIARFAYAEINQRPYVEENSPEGELKEFMEEQVKFLKDDFAVRLDMCVRDLSDHSPEGDIGDFRCKVSERLHGGVLSELRRLLGNLLTEREIVAILIDNLDKAWDRKEDLEHLDDFLFGLIRVAEDITRDFSKQDNKRKSVNMSITIFLRSDIFAHVINVAREPDKIQNYRLDWEDPEILMRVLYERLYANRKDAERDKLWQEVFCPKVKGISSNDYILQIILPRPRDLIFFAQAALSTAVNRGHDRVEELDIIEAEKQYSQFALESVKVENGITLPQLEAILYEFVGMPDIVTEDKAFSFIAKSGIEEKRKFHALNHLIALSFLGVEVDRNEFRYCTNAYEIQKLSKLKERYILNNNVEPRYRIHNAFHAFLEISNG
jgi:hypothetical protein